MGKIKIYKYNQEIYPYLFYVAITGDATKALLELKHIDISKVEYYADGWQGQAIPLMESYENATLILLNPEYIKPSVVAHEASHAAKDLFNCIGADPSDNETFEYLLGWIVDKCYDAIAKETSKNIK